MGGGKMINQYVVVGRIVSITKYGFTINATVRDGDKAWHDAVIPINITDSMKNNAMEYLKIGDVVGVKGHFDVNKSNKPIIVGDKLSFLSSADAGKEVSE